MGRLSLLLIASLSLIARNDACRKACVDESDWYASGYFERGECVCVKRYNFKDLTLPKFALSWSAENKIEPEPVKETFWWKDSE